MTKRRPVCTTRLVLAAGLIVGGFFPSVRAGEPAQQFLQGLRDRGFHDMAVEYLQQMKTSRLAPVELKETLLYEIGKSLIDASKQQKDMALREKQLDDAKTALQMFIGQHPDHALISAAGSQLGNLLVERGRIRVEMCKRPNADKAKLLGEARQFYDEGYKVFTRSKNELKEKLSKMTITDPKDKQAAELRDNLRAEYLQAQLLAAAVREETADTVQKGSQDYKTMLTESAEQYKEIYEKYRQLLAGLYARMYQGRCHLKLGSPKDALGFLSELLDAMEGPNQPEEIRTLQLKTMQLAAQGWAQSNLHAEAVKRMEPFVASARPNEARTADWLELRLLLAKAQWGLAQESKKGKASDAQQVKRLETEAKKNAVFVTRFPSDWQAESRTLVVAWGGTVAADTGAAEPKTFDEARQAGREAIEAMQTANLVLKTVPDRIQKEKDEAIKADLQKQLAESQETAGTKLKEALKYYRLTLGLADVKKNPNQLSDVNVAQYFLCFLNFSSGNYYEAALLGDFVARRYSDSPGARQCGKIAMASYLKLYAENPTPNKQFETQRAISIANYITQKWPDQPEAVEALNTLIPFMIQAGELAKAEEYLKGIPEDSPKRGDAEIKTGQAMWSAYLKGMQELRKWEGGQEPVPDGVNVPAKKASLEEMKGRAQKILEDGLNRMKKSEKVDDYAVTAALSLAQLYVDTGHADQAVAVLEDPQFGPLTLVKAGHAAAQREGVAAETYKTGLRAYISSLAGTADAEAVIKKANEVMDLMKGAIDQEQLINIYISLAKDLESQMKLLPSAEAKKALSKGFETFLDRLRAGATDLAVLSWVAETFSSLGSGFDTGTQLTAEAKKYYEQADSTYGAILEKVKFEDPKRRLYILIRRAMMKRKLLKFTDARDILKEVLQDNEMMLNLQVEGAKLYQDWAAFPGKEALYVKAMTGSEPHPKKGTNIIWGWGRLSLITAKYPEHRNTFHEARYNLAMCRYLYGLSHKDKDKQKEHLAKAIDSVIATQQTYGTGPEWEEWKPKYNKLVKDIQKALGQKLTGLPESKLPTVAPSTPTDSKAPAAAPAKAASGTTAATGSKAPAATPAAKTSSGAAAAQGSKAPAKVSSATKAKTN